MKRLLLHGMVNITVIGLLMRDTFVYPLLNLGGWLEILHAWAWGKIQNMEDNNDGA